MRIHTRRPQSAEMHARKAVALATAGVLAAGAGTVMMVTGAPAQADNPPGNNGTVKVAELGDVDEVPDNNPHLPCPFTVQWYGFDQGDISSQVSFELQEPTAGAAYDLDVVGPSTVFVGADPAGGAGNDLDGEAVYRLYFAGPTQAEQGFHVKLTVNTPGSKGNDSKSKVFWASSCQLIPTPTPTDEPTDQPTEEPDGTRPTEEPTDQPTDEPTEEPTDQPTEEPTGQPTALPTEDAQPPRTTKPDQVAPEEDGIVAPAEETLPTGVAAGMTGQQDPDDRWGAGLAGAGLVMMAVAGAARLRQGRRGEHQL